VRWPLSDPCFELARDPFAWVGSDGRVLRCNAAFTDVYGPDCAGHPLVDGVGDIAAAGRLTEPDATGAQLFVGAPRHASTSPQQCIETLPVPLFVHRDGRYIYANPAAVALIGYEHVDEIIGMELLSLIHPVDHAPTPVDHAPSTAHVNRIYETGAPTATRELRAVKKDGSRISVLVSGAEIAFDEGGFAVIEVARDLSDQSALTEQLRRGRRMEAIGRLAVGIAHDFNNLLSVILNYASFLSDELPPGSQVQAEAREIQHAAERASSLTQQLLMFGRGDMTQSESISLNDVVDDVSALLARTLSADIEITVTKARGLPLIVAARTHLEQILINLAFNARDATPSDGTLEIITGSLIVSAEEVDHFGVIAPGRYVTLEVADNGCGMSDDIASRAVEPFFTTKPTGAGTGLGLSTVYGIVTQAGGQLAIDSMVGRGTTVRILWPEAPAAVSPDQMQLFGERSAAGRATILLVEDDAAVRRLVSQMLRRLGYDVLEAINGAEAMQLVENEQPALDLLLTDVIMPQMNGKELSLALSPLYPSLPTVFMSGYTDDVLRDHATSSEQVALLAKPFTMDGLRASVEGVLSS
jgi:two-component system cell cycle sensor histidine kinase/response regulator CckA